MKRALAVGLFLLFGVVTSVRALTIDVGTHYLEPNTPGQSFQIFVAGGPTEVAGGLLIAFQVGDGGPEVGGTGGPAIAAADILTGTVFGAHPNLGDIGPGSIIPQVYETGTGSDYTPDQPYDPEHPEILPPEYQMNGLLATVTVDTTDFASGSWALFMDQKLVNPTFYPNPTTFYRNDSALTPVPVTITDGTLSIVTTVLNSIADGDWAGGGTWDGDGQVPTAGLKTAVGSHTVTVAGDGNAFAMALNQAGGKVVVDAGKTLGLGSIFSAQVNGGTLEVSGTVNAAGAVTVDAGKIALAATGVVNVGSDLALGANSELAVALSGSGGGSVAAAGDAALGGKLSLSASSLLKPAGTWGAVSGQIITAGVDVTDTFDTPPVAGSYLGHGVLYTGVDYQARTVAVNLFQAAPGDTTGATAGVPDREVSGDDIQRILGETKFNSGEPADWSQGDFNDDGICNSDDIQLILASALFNAGPYAAAAPQPAGYDGASLRVTPDGLLIDTAGATINGYVLESSAGVFTGAAADNLGVFTEDTDGRISGQMFFALNGEHLLGNVIGNEWAGVNLFQDLSMSYTIEGRSGIYAATVVVPEPATAVLAASGAALLGLLWLRRRQRKA